MSKLKAFVGHSFNDSDSSVVDYFLKYLNGFEDIGLEWDHAERAEPKELAIKVKEKMEGKNLFIGIFTVKSKQIDASKLSISILSKSTLKAKKEDFTWSTSDWVIQESGYALGKGMKTIFLVEEGINAIGGLQGNIEHIPFTRNNISLSDSKLNEMLTSLLREKEDISDKVQPAEQTVEVKEQLPTEPIQREKPEDSQHPLKELLDAIKERDETKEKEAFAKFLESEGDGTKEKKIELTAYYYWVRYKFGKKDILKDLLALSKNNPQHPEPHIWLGNLYEEFKQDEKAASHFVQSSELSSTDEDKSAFICKAATAYVKAGKLKEGKELLLNYIGKHSGDTFENFDIYKTLANLQKEANNYERFFSLAEKAIDLKPTDNSFRFDLAYAYSKQNNHIMALHHYNILCNSTPNESNWNNIGVELSELELKGKAVGAYLKSKELGGTTPVGNLAYKLIDAGYFEMAKEYLHEALKDKDCSSNISSALSNLEKRIAKEDKDEKEFLSKSVPELKFRIKYAEAYTQGNEISIRDVQWKSPHGEIKINVKGNRFKAVGEYEVSKAGLADIYGGSVLARALSPMTDIDIKKIEYKGVFINGIIDYTLSVTTTPKDEPNRILMNGSLLGGLKDAKTKISNYSGQMIVSPDGKSIEVMEKDSKNKVDFYDLFPVK